MSYEKKLLLFIITLSTVEVLFQQVCVAQQAGDLDVAFGNGGKVITNFFAGDDRINSLVIDLDGKIIAGGFAYHTSSNSDFALARYNINGTLDNTFGSNGKVTTDFGCLYDFIFSIAIQSDRKIIAVGSTYNSLGSNSFFALARYNPDGSLDNTFGINGKIATQVGNTYDVASAVALQEDGKIVVGGYSQNNITGDDYAVARYYINGTLDNTFGNNGIVTLDLYGERDVVRSMLIQPDGKIVLAGYSNSSNQVFSIARFNSDGALDSGFGIGGKLITEIGSNSDIISCVALQPDNKIVVSGNSYNDSGSQSFFALARYFSNGVLDTTFGNGGIMISNMNGSANSIAIQLDGKMIAVGATYVSNNADFAVIRYDSNGNIDNDFGNGGVVITPIGLSHDMAFSVRLQSDQYFVVGGSSENGQNLDFALARYNRGLDIGVPELENESKISIYPNPASSSITINGQFTIDNGQLKIMNIQGQLVQQLSIVNFPLSIDVQHFSPGIYFLSLSDGEKMVNKKFVKE